MRLAEEPIAPNRTPANTNNVPYDFAVIIDGIANEIDRIENELD